MKRAFVYILGGICLIAVLFLFPSGQKEKTEQKSEKVRLEFYNRKREVYAVLEEIIEKFNASQDDFLFLLN